MLSKKNIRKTVRAFQKKHGVPVILIHPRSNKKKLIGVAGPARLTAEDRKRLEKGLPVETLHDMSGEAAETIILDEEYILGQESFDESILETILSHELGHIRTAERFSPGQRRYESFLSLILNGFFTVLMQKGHDRNEIAREQFFIHHQMPWEKAADEFAGADIPGYCDKIYGSRPSGYLPGLDWQTLLDTEPEERLLFILESGQLKADDLDYFIMRVIKTYLSCVTDDELLDLCLKNAPEIIQCFLTGN